LIQIRDDPGEDRAADRTVQLKLIQIMEGANSKAPAVTVNVDHTSNHLVRQIMSSGCPRLGPKARP
jgi:hypothetical protein